MRWRAASSGAKGHPRASTRPLWAGCVGALQGSEAVRQSVSFPNVAPSLAPPGGKLSKSTRAGTLRRECFTTSMTPGRWRKPFAGTATLACGGRHGWIFLLYDCGSFDGRKRAPIVSDRASCHSSHSFPPDPGVSFCPPGCDRSRCRFTPDLVGRGAMNEDRENRDSPHLSLTHSGPFTQRRRRRTLPNQQRRIPPEWS